MPNLKSEVLKNQKLIRYLLPIGGMIVATVIVPLTVFPLWDNISSLRAELSQTVAKLSRLNQKIAQIDQVRQGIATYRAEFASLDQSYPSAKDVPALIIGVSKLASENNLLIESFRINPGEVVATNSAVAASESAASASATSSGPTVPQIVSNTSSLINPEDGLLLELSIRGAISDQREFIKKLSEVRRVMFIDNISLSFKEGDGYTTRYQIEVPYGGLPPLLLPLEEPLPILSERTKDLIASLEALPLYTGSVNLPPE